MKSNIISIEELQVDWSFEDEYSVNQGGTEHYISRLKEVNKLPFNTGEIFFSDNIWDFSSVTRLNISKSKLVFNFGRTVDLYHDDLKAFVLIKLLENKIKVQSINSAFSHLCLFFNYIYDKNVFSIKDITSEHIGSYLRSRSESSERTLRKARTSILEFYECYSANFDDILSSDIRKALEHGDFKAFKAIAEANKTPNIPDSFFDKLIKVLLKSIDSPVESEYFKGIACVLLLESQTGLRRGEILSIEMDALKPVKLFNGTVAHYLKYTTWKREGGNNVATIATTYINELSKKAFDTLLDLHKDNRLKRNSNYLYCPKKAKLLPLTVDAFSRTAVSYYIFYGNELDSIDCADKYPDLQSVSLKGRPYVYLFPGAKTVSYPTNPQFRVHVCTELYNKGIPLKYIQKFMGHLSAQMQGYYVRPKENQIQEDIEFSKKTIEDVVTGNAKLLGPDASGITNRINQFIEENNYNVAVNIEEISEGLLKTIPIRAKTGGVCIKSSPMRECSKDAMTNEFYCAYGVCPNIFHFFYMVNVSYRQSKELVQTITLNKKRGHLKQAHKESNMLKTIARSKLIPELDELKKEVERKGVQEIMIQYPDLIEIIEDFDNIYREASEWTALNGIL